MTRSKVSSILLQIGNKDTRTTCLYTFILRNFAVNRIMRIIVLCALFMLTKYTIISREEHMKEG